MEVSIGFIKGKASRYFFKSLRAVLQISDGIAWHFPHAVVQINQEVLQETYLVLGIYFL
jgi:hypothetical protein